MCPLPPGELGPCSGDCLIHGLVRSVVAIAHDALDNRWAAGFAVSTIRKLPEFLSLAPRDLSPIVQPGCCRRVSEFVGGPLIRSVTD